MIAPKISQIFKKTTSLQLFINSSYCTNSFRQKDYIVTVLDASCKIGRYLALLLKQNPAIGELRLYDKSNNICVVAEDLSHIDTKTKIKSFGGRPVLKHAITDADIVISVGGCKQSHKETAKLMFDKNVDDMRIAALHMIEFNPKGVFCICKPPVESLVPMVTEEYKKAGLYDNRKIIGITNVASMRANSYIAAATGHGASDILCPVVGGASTNCVVAVLSQVRPKDLKLGTPDACQKNISNAEDDLLKLYADCGTVCLTPALAISRFINTLLKAFKGETNCVECAFVRQTGHIGQFLPYMTSIVRLGRHGIMSSHMPKVNGEEALLLKKASIIIKDHIRTGESFVTGESFGTGEVTTQKDPIGQDNPPPSAAENVAKKTVHT